MVLEKNIYTIIEIIRELMLLFTLSLELGPSWETNKFLAGQEMVFLDFLGPSNRTSV
jgi:hypothetical protein